MVLNAIYYGCYDRHLHLRAEVRRTPVALHVCTNNTQNATFKITLIIVKEDEKPTRVDAPIQNEALPVI